MLVSLFGLGGVRECVTKCSVPAESLRSIRCFSLTLTFPFTCTNYVQGTASNSTLIYTHSLLSKLMQTGNVSLTHSVTHTHTEYCFVAMKGLLVNIPAGHTEKQIVVLRRNHCVTAWSPISSPPSPKWHKANCWSCWCACACVRACKITTVGTFKISRGHG